MRSSFLFQTAAVVCAIALPARADEVPEKYHKSIARGLEYLAQKQHKDGHWESEDGKYPVAITALAGMAFLMEYTQKYEVWVLRPEAKERQPNVRKAVDWLLAKSEARKDGLVYSDHPSETDRYMYGHGLALQFLAWAHLRNVCHNDRAERLKKAVTRGLMYLARSQSSQGGWYRTSRVEGHDFQEVLATTLQFQAIWTVRKLRVPPNSDIDRLVGTPALWDAIHFPEIALARYEEGAEPAPSPGRLTETAAALCCRPWDTSAAIAAGNDGKLVKKWFNYCKAELPRNKHVAFGRDELAHYYYAQAVYSIANDPLAWLSHREWLFEQLMSKQNMDGSWPAAADIVSGGSVYATVIPATVAALRLQAIVLIR